MCQNDGSLAKKNFIIFLVMAATTMGVGGIQHVLQSFLPSMSDGHEAVSFVGGMRWFKAICNHNSH